jgi:hypothetical protein
MKTGHIAVTVFVLLTGLAGCFIQSFQPFYTPETVIPLESIRGEWMLTAKGDANVKDDYPEPWVFSETSLLTYEKGIASILDVTFFKAGDTVFMDLTPGVIDETTGPNGWWAMHNIPTHSVCRVDLDGATLKLTPLDGEWLVKKIQAKEISLPMLAIDASDNYHVLNASSAKLVEFLRTFGRNSDAFPAFAAHQFHRKGTSATPIDSTRTISDSPAL